MEHVEHVILDPVRIFPFQLSFLLFTLLPVFVLSYRWSLSFARAVDSCSWVLAVSRVSRKERSHTPSYRSPFPLVNPSSLPQYEGEVLPSDYTGKGLSPFLVATSQVKQLHSVQL